MTKSTILAVLFYAGVILCGVGSLGLLCGISDKANAISAIIGMVGMVMTYTAARYTPKRPTR